jgi:hypothetical protein
MGGSSSSSATAEMCRVGSGGRCAIAEMRRGGESGMGGSSGWFAIDMCCRGASSVSAIQMSGDSGATFAMLNGGPVGGAGG